MITEFSISCGFLGSPYFHDEQLRIAHDIFIKNWQYYGILIASAKCFPEYQVAIDKLPEKYRSLWKTAFAHGRILSVDNCADIGEMADFEQAKTLATYYRTVFVEEDLSYVLCANEQLSRFCETTSFEVVGAPVLTSSENIKKSISACEMDIFAGDNINELWERRFRNLAKYSKKIFISDRYLFERIISDVERGVLNTNIKCFFELLLGVGGQYYITIGSDGGALGSQENIEIRNYFEALFKKCPQFKASIKRLTLISNDKRVFQKHAHDRYVRFEEHVCEVGVGMAIFERNALSNTTMSIKLKRFTSCDDIEKELRADPAWTQVVDI